MSGEKGTVVPRSPRKKSQKYHHSGSGHLSSFELFLIYSVPFITYISHLNKMTLVYTVLYQLRCIRFQTVKAFVIKCQNKPIEVVLARFFHRQHQMTQYFGFDYGLAIYLSFEIIKSKKKLFPSAIYRYSRVVLWWTLS
jgi:hypothetical protein